MFEINNCHEQRYEKCYLWSYSTFSPSLSISVKYRLMIESSEQSVLILRQTEGRAFVNYAHESLEFR